MNVQSEYDDASQLEEFILRFESSLAHDGIFVIEIRTFSIPKRIYERQQHNLLWSGRHNIDFFTRRKTVKQRSGFLWVR